LAFGHRDGHSCTGRWTAKCTALRSHAPTVDSLRGNPWAVLGLSSKASRSEVKARYRALVRQYHPDVGPAGSGYMMKQVIEAAEAILQSLPKQTPEPESAHQHASRYEKLKAKQEKAKADQDFLERFVYSGRSRVRAAMWSNCRITMANVEITWPLAPYKKQRGDARKLVKFQDVRRILSRGAVAESGRVDLELELAWGTKLTLERLPVEVAAQVAQSVQSAQLRREARLANIMGVSR